MHFHRLLIVLMTRVRRSRLASINIIVLALLLSVLGNSLCFLYFDGGGEAGPSLGDALWYSVISLTTIGYGDFSAASTGARVGTVVFIVIFGLISFSMLVGIIADWVLDLAMKGQRGMAPIHERDHIVIVNMPGEGRLRQVVRELASDPQFGSRPQVLVSDQITELPIDDKQLAFVHGSPLDEQTWEQANVGAAALVLVLPISYTDANSDAVVASTVSVLRRVAGDRRIVAECLDERRRNLFGDLPLNISVVAGLQVAGNILIQELADPGVSKTMEEITSNLRGTTLFSTRVSALAEHNYTVIAKALLDHDANLLSVIRGEAVHTSFAGLQPQTDDHLVYVGRERLEWARLVACAD